MLQVVRENDCLLPQLSLYHSDHCIPLFRLQVWLVAKLAGSSIGAAGTAMWFNGLIFLSCAGLLLAGTWLLHELGCSALARFAFPFCLWLWPGWGEFTAGYFTFSMYVQVLACGAASVAAALRYFRGGSHASGGLGLLLAVLAVGIDNSGYSAFATLGIFCLCDFAANRDARSLNFLAGLVIIFLLLQWFFSAVFSHAYSARELVQNPGGKSFSLLSLSVSQTSLFPIILALLSAIGGVILGYATPIFLQFYNNWLSPDMVLILYGVQLVAFLVSARLLWPALKRLAVKDGIMAAGLAVCAMAGVGMVVVGRTPYVAATPTFLWQPKYLAFSIFWLCLGGLFLADRLRRFHPSPHPKVAIGCVALLVFGAWFTFSVWHFERALLPGPTSYITRGRYGNVVTARARTQQYHSVMEQLSAMAEHRGGERHLKLPSPERWSGEFFSHYQLLEWGSDHGSTGVTHLFWDMPAAAPNLKLWGHWAPVSSLTETARQNFMAVPWLVPAFTTNAAPVSRQRNQ